MKLRDESVNWAEGPLEELIKILEDFERRLRKIEKTLNIGGG